MRVTCRRGEAHSIHMIQLVHYRAQGGRGRRGRRRRRMPQEENIQREGEREGERWNRAGVVIRQWGKVRLGLVRLGYR